MLGQAPTSFLPSSGAAITPYLEPKDSPGCSFFLNYRARTEKKSSQEIRPATNRWWIFRSYRQDGFYRRQFLNCFRTFIYMYFQTVVLFILSHFKDFGNFRYLKFFSRYFFMHFLNTRYIHISWLRHVFTILFILHLGRSDFAIDSVFYVKSFFILTIFACISNCDPDDYREREIGRGTRFSHAEKNCETSGAEENKESVEVLSGAAFDDWKKYPLDWRWCSGIKLSLFTTAAATGIGW